jgi:hypothetical protein
MYVCVRVYVYVYLLMCVYVYVFMCVCVCTYVCVCVLVCMRLIIHSWLQYNINFREVWICFCLTESGGGSVYSGDVLDIPIATV